VNGFELGKAMAATRRTVKEYLDTLDDARGVLPARSNRTTLDCTVALFRLSVPERDCAIASG
jgi:hypothetical protein